MVGGEKAAVLEGGVDSVFDESFEGFALGAEKGNRTVVFGVGMIFAGFGDHG